LGAKLSKILQLYKFYYRNSIIERKSFNFHAYLDAFTQKKCNFAAGYGVFEKYGQEQHNNHSAADWALCPDAPVG
jgi:hypothetical protein